MSFLTRRRADPFDAADEPTDLATGTAAVPAAGDPRPGRRLGRSRAVGATPARPADPVGEWTFGTSLATRAVHIALVGCLATGPVALIYAATRVSSPVEQTLAAAPAPQTSTTSDTVQAAATAQRLVVAWLTASEADGPTLEAQLLEPDSSIDLQLPTTRPAAPSRVWTENVEALTINRWAVTIGAQGGSAGTGTYYLVPVQVEASAAAALTLPARTPGPVKASVGSLDATDPPLAIAAADPASVTVSGYLDALLAGSGDLDRWTSPGATLTAISPAPCRSVDVQEVTTAADQMPTASVDDTQLTVLAVATCTAPPVKAAGTGATQVAASTVSQYPLVLCARGGRWEVSATNPALTDPTAPASTPQSASTPASSPSTTGSATTTASAPVTPTATPTAGPAPSSSPS